MPAYREITQAGSRNWVAYLHAFYNGLFYPLRFGVGKEMQQENTDFYRSAIGHLLQIFGIPTPLYRDLREGALDLSKIV